MKLLQKNIRRHLEFEKIEAEVWGNWDFISVKEIENKSPFFSLSQVLARIPWIGSLQEILETEYRDFDDACKKTLKYFSDKVEGKTFCVRVKRTGNHDFNSIDLERYIWGGIAQHVPGVSVNLKNPEYTIMLEVRDKKFRIIKEKIYGVGGYPISFQDRVVSLISGGFDSGVSTYSMMKRGCEVDYLFFNLGWSAHELWVKQVAFYLWKMFGVSHKRARFISIPFDGVLKELLTKVDARYRGVLLKRYMLKVASMVSKDHYYAIVKWDSLGQVSSQTLKNMHVIDKASDTLVLRPLISQNKQEIVDISKKIGTYNFACNMPEYCGVISDKPATGATLEQVGEQEIKVDEWVLTEAFENRSVEFVKEMLDSYAWENAGEIETVLLPGQDEVIIDIREPIKTKKQPFTLEWVEVQSIPFFDINHVFKDLDQSKTYLFYCEKWVLSNLHGLYLKEQGFSNIKVLRPIEKDKVCGKI